MAEYYPLLSKAVSGLRDAPPERRRAIYDRARQALVGQLRSMEQANPDLIDRETRALDEAIAQLEGEIDITAALASAPFGEVAAASPPLPPPEPVRPAAAPRVPAPPPPRAATAVPAPTRPAVPQPSRPERASATLPARPPVSATPAPRPAANPAPARPEPAPAPAAPVAAAARAPVPTEPTAETPAPSPTPPVVPELRAFRPSEEPASPPMPLAPRLKIKPATSDAGEQGSVEAGPAQDSEGEPPLSPDPALTERDEVVRPAAPRHVAPAQRFSPRVLIVAVVAALVVAGIAYTAWRLRDKPEALARARAAMEAAHQSDAQPGKLVNRADGGAASPTGGAAAPPTIAPDATPTGERAPPSPSPDETATTPPVPAATPAPETPSSTSVAAATAAAPAPVSAPQAATADGSAPAPTPSPTAPATPAVATSTSPADNAAVPVAQRAAFLVDAPDAPQKVRTYVGTVVWKSENVSPGQGQPLATAVRAEVDIPDAKMKLSVLIQKNVEAQFPASHTIELRFTDLPGNTLGAVKQINVPQMRKDDAPTGDALAGLPVTITENYFLVGLSRGSDEVARNLDLLKTRNWFDIPCLLTSGKVAKITFEKGPSGERLINDAIQSWQ